jgi:hypothetical protein
VGGNGTEEGKRKPRGRRVKGGQKGKVRTFLGFS